MIHWQVQLDRRLDWLACALRRRLVASERASRACCCGAAVQLAGGGAGCAATEACSGSPEPALGGCRWPRATRAPAPLRGLSKAPGGARERGRGMASAPPPVRYGAGSGASSAGSKHMPPETVGVGGRARPFACVIWCVWCPEARRGSHRISRCWASSDMNDGLSHHY